MIAVEPHNLKTINDILKKYPYTFYTYGSRAKKSRTNSDLDILFFTPIPFNIQAHIDEDFKNSDLPFLVDLSDYNLMTKEFRDKITDDLIIIQASDKFLQAEKNLFAKLCYLPKLVGSHYDSNSDYIAINAGLKTSMFNTICDAKFKNDSDIKEKIESILKYFGDKPFAWWLGPSSEPKDLNRILQNYNLNRETIEYAMYLDLKELPPFHSSNELTILPIKKTEQLHDFNSVLKSVDKFAPDFYEKLVAIDFYNDKNFCLFLGYFKGIPVTIGSLFFSSKIAGIYDLITLAEYRNKGFGSEMLQHLLNKAKENGFKKASLSASSLSGFSIYKKIGFTPLGIFYCLEKK